jgi:hypothetical protein
MRPISDKPFNLAAVLLAGLMCLPLLLLPAEAVPWALAGLGLVSVGLVLMFGQRMLLLLLGWLVAASVGGEFLWRGIIPGFFNLTVDRIVLAGLIVLFIVGLLAGEIRFRWPGWLGAVLVILVGWCALSAQVAGWTLPFGTIAGSVISPPFYPFFAGLLFPAVIFLMAVSVVRREGQIQTVLVFFTLFGIYLAVVGLAQWFKVDVLVWPKYILDTSLGIHAERVRGPFLNAPDMGLALVICLFATLLLAIRSSPAWRIVLVLLSLPMVMATYLTLTRSIWLALVLCAFLAIWVWPRARSTRWALSCVLTVCLVMFVFLRWSSLTSSQREQGGVAEAEPVISRIEAAQISLELTAQHPLLGTGLGHFMVKALDSPHMRTIGQPGFAYSLGMVEHNNFLSMLAETGIPGATAYIALLLGLLGASIRLYRMIPPTATGLLDRRFVGFYWIAWLAFFTDSMFRLTTSSPLPNSLFLLLGAVVVAYYHELRPQSSGLAPSRIRPVASRGGLDPMPGRTTHAEGRKPNA